MERRSNNRHLAFFCPAYIRTKDVVRYAFLRNLSHDGASFGGVEGLNAGDEIQYHVGDLEPVTAIVKWVSGKTVGVRNVAARISDLTLSTNYPYRSVRLPTATAVTLYVGGQRCAGTLRDFSQSGACVELAVQLRPGQLVSLELGGLSVESATVKWVKGQRVGIRFARPLGQEAVSKALQRLNLHDGANALEPV